MTTACVALSFLCDTHIVTWRSAVQSNYLNDLAKGRRVVVRGGGRRGRGEFLHPMLMNRSDMPFKRSPELFFLPFFNTFFSLF